jgi:hypothetical protein
MKDINNLKVDDSINVGSLKSLTIFKITTSEIEYIDVFKKKYDKIEIAYISGERITILYQEICSEWGITIHSYKAWLMTYEYK